MTLLDEDAHLVGHKNALIVSYGFSNLDKKIAAAQKAVFDKFGIPLNQFEGEVSHPCFMDSIMKDYHSDYYIFFDVDCIPLNDTLIDYIIKSIKTTSMIGIEQQCNSKGVVDHIYAGPACFGISRKFHDELGNPSFKETRRSDVGEELTYTCEKLGKPFKLLKKTHSDNEIWRLGPDRMFGHGTTYDNDLLYHQFEVRLNAQKFLDKCHEVLNKK